MPTPIERMERQPVLRERLYGLLDEAITVDGAVYGTVQFVNHERKVLKLVANRGFDAQTLAEFDLIEINASSVCARAYRSGRRVMIGDTSADPFFSRYFSFLRNTPFSSVQSTPIFDHHGQVAGILTTHFAKVHQLSDSGCQQLEAIAPRMADLFFLTMPA